MKVKLDHGAYMPERAHESDAGLDLRSRELKIVKANSYAEFHTGVHIELPRNTCGLIVSKSGLNVKHGITSTGLIDEGYTGEIVVKLYNRGDDYLVCAGDKISQLLILPVVYTDLVLVDKLEETERGDAGFGSTGI